MSALAMHQFGKKQAVDVKARARLRTAEIDPKQPFAKGQDCCRATRIYAHRVLLRSAKYF